jgi:hypothetical protein
LKPERWGSPLVQEKKGPVTRDDDDDGDDDDDDNNNNNNLKTCKQPLYFIHIFTTNEQGMNWHDEPQQSYKLTANGRRQIQGVAKPMLALLN